MRLDVHKEAEERMEMSLEVLKDELNSIRAGRANPNLIEGLEVDYYGTMTPLNQIAGVSAPEARMLMVQPWDANAIPAIEKAVLQSDLGLNPSNDGKVIRLPIPALTEERRKDLVKLVKKNGEEAKVSIRNIRRDANDDVKKLEKDKEISEDERKAAEDIVQEITDKYTKLVDETVDKKEKELMEI